MRTKKKNDTAKNYL